MCVIAHWKSLIIIFTLSGKVVSIKQRQELEKQTPELPNASFESKRVQVWDFKYS